MNKFLDDDPSSPLHRPPITKRETEIIPGHVENYEEIMDLMIIAYQAANLYNNPEETRPPDVIQNLNELKNQLEKDLLDREKEKIEINEHSLAWQDWAAQQSKKRDLSLNREKMKRLHDALKNPEVKDLLLNVMKHKITPQQAFHDIKANPDLKNKIQGLTFNGKLGGKSYVFRRKNKKTTFKSRRNAQHTRRHRKSSTRRSTRK